ncbi:hypothetical protein QK290_07255 [Pseudarthrobacter sp. AL07]|nr:MULTISPECIES: hypothetical protein [unclassified Pseudarthrobacter]MDI3194250.1 hypothetical protein [Pseudarthrobacter sp. AL20]MDI3208316.1 hypothetical protein [Pseudarthrobacter sp. AL07]
MYTCSTTRELRSRRELPAQGRMIAPLGNHFVTWLLSNPVRVDAL